MKIAFLNSEYRVRGGEDVSFEVDAKLLRDHGHDVRQTVWKNSAIGAGQSFIRQLWSNQVYRDVREILLSFKPDVVHFQNTQYAFGPAAIHAASDSNLPVVVALSNERLAFGWRDVVANPYNGSLTQSAALALGGTIHRRLTWARKVDRFIAVSDYIRRQMTVAGLPRISVKPDTVYPAPEFRHDAGRRFLFAGRLCPEKGVPVLLEAWRQLPGLELDVVGRLPEQPKSQVGVTFHGSLPHAQTLEMMAKARAVIVPSVWPEPSGRVVREAMACGTPVIASLIGGLPESRPAVQVYPGDAQKLAQAVRMVSMWSPSEVVRQRLIARAEFERACSPELQVGKLIDAYQRAIEHRAARGVRYSPGELDDPATRAHLARFDNPKEMDL